VPAGTSQDVNRWLGETTDIELVSLQWHTVKRGETLATIARTLGISRADLAEANDLRVTARVGTGQRLLVPQGAGVLKTPRTELSATSAARGAGVKSTYSVQKGDTLTSIARKFGATIEDVKTWNPALSEGRLLAGQRLTVYKGRN
jgi:LysM repeat protein